MAIVGLIPFVYAAIKKKRRSVARSADRCAGLAPGGAARGHQHARGAYHHQTRSCHFAVRPSPDDGPGFSFDGYGAARCHQAPKAEEDLPREPLPAVHRERTTSAAPARGRESAPLFDGVARQSQSCRFAVRPPPPVHELVVSRDEGASRRPPAQREDLSRKLLLPASRHDGLALGVAQGRELARSSGSAYQSQSCRFAVRSSAAYELALSSDEEYSAASQPSEDLSGKLLLPAAQGERGLSRTLRFSSMRVFAWASGA